MTIGLIGTKSGMTRVFNEDGLAIPVTVIEVLANRITQVKSTGSDRYDALQVTTGIASRSRINKALEGHYRKSETDPGRGLWELRGTKKKSGGSVDSCSLGDELTVDRFFVGQIVDVSGTSKGKGFAGAIKRWHFRRQDMSHGNSKAHRAAGSIGQCQTPGKVFKGKKMAGRLGNARVTVQNLTVVGVDAERHTLMVKGAVPGPNGGDVLVRPSVKAGKQTAPVARGGDE